MLDVKIIKLSEKTILPTYATDGSAGLDFYAIERHELMRGHPHTFRTGLAIEIPVGYVLLLFSRSGHGFRNDIRLSNCTGVIDSDYRGEVLIKMCQDFAVPTPENEWGAHVVIEPGHRIAQGIVLPYPRVNWVVTEALTETQRGEGGLGSTGS